MPWNENLKGAALNFAGSISQKIRCLAGPGTGKTFAMMRRVQRLLESETPPSRILVVTLTRTAAIDLKKNLIDLDVPGADDVVASTLHSLCFRMLSRDMVLEMTGRIPRILADFERDILLKDLPDNLGNFTQKKNLLKLYENAWSENRSEPHGDPPEGLPREFQIRLIESFRINKCMLVSELVPIALSFLRHNLHAEEFNWFDHILVDEYQDLNRADQEIILLLMQNSFQENRGQLAIVGDDDQAIYVMLRNAFPEGIVEFPADHDSTLTECRRCPKRVVSMANRLISHNHVDSHSDLQFREENIQGEIHNIVFQNSEEEATGIANFIHHKLSHNQIGLGDVLVLANWREIAYGIRDNLIQLGHDAHSYFSEQSLDSMDAKKALILFTLLANENDLVSIRSWLALEGGNGQNRTGYRRILCYARDSDLSIKEILDQLSSSELSISHTNRLIESYDNLKNELERYQTESCDLESLIDSLLPVENSNLHLLRQAAHRSLELINDYEIHAFVDELRKQIGQPEVPLEADHIRLMSLHKSKGLTSKLVVVAGLVEGLIPKSTNENLSPSELEKHLQEQRRVLYVGLTRTTDILVLSRFQRILAQSAHICGAAVGNWAGRGVRNTISSSFFQEFGPNIPRAVRGNNWQY